MKFTAILSALLVSGALASAATPAPAEHWVSRNAQAVIDRMNAAYAAIDGWTATIEEQRTPVNGADAAIMQMTERYVRGSGSTDYFASTEFFKDKALVSSKVNWQNADACYLLFRSPRGELIGQSSPPSEFNRPLALHILKAIGKARYVRHGGWDSVAGKYCDILDVISVNEIPVDPGQPAQPPDVQTERCYIDPAGFIVRHTFMVGWWTQDGLFVDQRFTYDPKAGLTAADFSRDNFERAAAAEILRGDPMPELVEQLHRSGGTLPEVSFTAWADKKPFRVSDLKGKVVVLETWASWCHFCKEAFPFYEKMRKSLAEQDVVFVAVSFDEKLENYEKWMVAHGADYGFKFGRIDAEDPKKAMKDFKGSLPAFYVVGRDGKIISSYMGYGYGKGGEDPRLLDALRKAGVKI